MDDDTKPLSSNVKLSTQYYQANTLDKDLWFRVATRDYTELLATFDFGELFSRLPTPMDLLDVGCGTGKFPAMLSAHLPSSKQVEYDYLDPSAHCLSELRKTLPLPFVPRTGLQTTFESLDCSTCPSQDYHLIWCIQSLYCVQQDALVDIVKKLHTLLDQRNGIALIYLASSEAFYHRLYKFYNNEVFPCIRQPYITAEEVITALDSAGIRYTCKKLQFPHTIALCESEVLANYLNQCVFDENGWENFQKNGPLKKFLESFQTSEGYEFPQEVWLIMFGANLDRLA